MYFNLAATLIGIITYLSSISYSSRIYFITGYIWNDNWSIRRNSIMSSFKFIFKTFCTDFDHCSTGWQKQNNNFQLANHGAFKRMDRSRQVFSSLRSKNIFGIDKVSRYFYSRYFQKLYLSYLWSVTATTSISIFFNFD